MANPPSTSIHSSNNSSIQVMLRGPFPYSVCYPTHPSAKEAWRQALVCITAVVCLESSSTKSRITGYSTEERFTVPSEELFCGECGDTMRNLLDLMNIPFSLDDELQWSHQCEKKTLENSQDLIEQLAAKFRLFENPATATRGIWFVELFIRKIVTLPDHEFEEWRSFRQNDPVEYHRMAYQEPRNQTRWRRAALNVLERVRVEKGDDADSGEGSSDACPICLEDLVKEGGDHYKIWNAIRLPCSHVFHEACILRWLDDKSSCPNCRAKCPLIEIPNSI